MIDIDFVSLTVRSDEPLKEQLRIRFLRRKLPLLIVISECCAIPPYYGAVRRCEDRLNIFCALIPLNIPIAFGFWFYGWLRTGCARFLWRHRAK